MKFRSLMLLASLVVPTAVLGANALDAALPDYEQASGVSGNLTSIGSDTLANLMAFWAEAFKKQYPNITVEMHAAGSSTAPPALTEGTSNLGPMSRKMKSEELEAFEAKHGYKPTAIAVAIDALAVFVHKDNPLTEMTLPQIDAVFSATRACGYDSDITTWGDLGVSGELAGERIQIYGRNSASGTYGYFKKKALCKGDFRNTVKEQPGSASVVQSITTSLNAIGYSGVGYRTSGVKTLALAKGPGDDYVAANPEQAITGKYPLARFLYVYVNKQPNKPLPPLEREFLRMVLSKIGQTEVIKDGYIPLPAEVVEKQLKKL